MKQKNILSIITATILLAVSVLPCAARAYPAASYNIDDASLDISGSIGTKAGTVYTLTVAKRGSYAPGFGISDAPLAAYVFKTGYGGEISEKLPLSANFEGGEYSAIFAYVSDEGAVKTEVCFSYTNGSEPATAELVDKLNTAGNLELFTLLLTPRENITKFGIVYDNVYNEESGINIIPFMAEVVYSYKHSPENINFTFDEYTSALFESMAAHSIRQNGLDAMDSITQYMGDNAENLSMLSDDENKILDSLLKDADYKSARLSDILTEKLILCRFLGADTRLKMKSVLEDYANVLSLDISKGSKYSKIADEKRHLVYEGMMEDMDINTTLEDIKDIFDRHVDNAYKKSTSTSGGGSSSFGGGSRISADVDITNPNLTKQPELPPSSNLPESGKEPEKEPKFTDIAGHFSEECVNRLASDGIINGYPNGSFDPDGNITRAEFAKLASLALEIEGDAVSAFSDVELGSWYEKAVGILAGKEIIVGSNGLFMPHSPITRQDAAVIAMRILNYKGAALSGEAKSFADSNDISDYARKAVDTLSGAQILNGDGVNLYPLSSITRGEAAVLICNVLDVILGGEAK